ncbi:MAG: hypothetical protein A6F71_10740 [Cycloclasticus sp. symbiont of Poecilosclerida sp. M]|nr:MAG: hypothetical protein A6F71_10740 [Cycloclasticus sp. symbiont of Poecilosclerida sp. M]
MRPFKLWVVVGEKPFINVPKATLRKLLNKNGRVKKVEFRRSMSPLQIKNRIISSFPTLRLESPIFMKCVELKMVHVDIEGGTDGYPCGSVIQSIASKESLYLVESKVNFKLLIL